MHKNYLKALNLELETNIKALDVYILRTLSDIEEGAKTHRLLNIPEAKNYNDSVLKYSMVSRPVYKATLATSTFNDLINAGVLENLNDSKLKFSLSQILKLLISFIDSFVIVIIVVSSNPILFTLISSA